ncbi:hypothetical protein SORBI_3002G169766 [Sorghum bicolor]|uniref:Uncharacterized protein n=1 Tax=Sorghum bicolor TaxID=4558 RepID=A0A1W0W4N9_SORBI|nr:hypothetical protein SORBI_3002G169766 [Sorghum bicolor]
MQMLYCCEHVGPIRGRFAALMVLLLRWMLYHRCCLGPLACRFFAVASALAPSADALPRRWFSLLGRMLCCLEFLADVLPLLGPLSCKFSTLSVLAPSANALPRRWSRCLGRCFAAWSF